MIFNLLQKKKKQKKTITTHTHTHTHSARSPTEVAAYKNPSEAHNSVSMITRMKISLLLCLFLLPETLHSYLFDGAIVSFPVGIVDHCRISFGKQPNKNSPETQSDRQLAAPDKPFVENALTRDD
jgi:hypothetical protein